MIKPKGPVIYKIQKGANVWPDWLEWLVKKILRRR